eukprot:6179435-Pleurochrysis_carterae.AAC.1
MHDELFVRVLLLNRAISCEARLLGARPHRNRTANHVRSARACALDDWVQARALVRAAVRACIYDRFLAVLSQTYA